MRSISKARHCIENAKKCALLVYSYSICMLLAPTKADHDLCSRKYSRALKHAKKYVELANYYGGSR